MEADPFGGDLKYLKNDPRGAYRRRVGSWRIIFDADMQGHMIHVKAITRRTSTTY
jgi:mRNA-degrading endonuclease RelE of RelBE toxin-antitoxin system